AGTAGEPTATVAVIQAAALPVTGRDRAVLVDWAFDAATLLVAESAVGTVGAVLDVGGRRIVHARRGLGRLARDGAAAAGTLRTDATRCPGVRSSEATQAVASRRERTTAVRIRAVGVHEAGRVVAVVARAAHALVARRPDAVRAVGRYRAGDRL